MNKFWLVLAIAFLLFSFTFAQDNSPSKKDKKKSEVKINVRVSDTEDNFVNDVNIEDVKLYENGIEQKITNFEKKMPLNVGIVVDNSGSMQTRLEDVSIAGATLVKNLLPNDEAFIIRFVDSDKIETLEDWTSDKSVLIKSFQDWMFVERGQSAVIDALHLSSQKILERAKKDISKRYALVLISDGEERESYYKLQDVLKILNGSNVQVFSIAIIDSNMSQQSKLEGKSLIKKITLQTEGASYFPKKFKKEKGYSNELISALKSIVLELRSQYVLTYVPTNKDFESEKRKLKIVISDGANGKKRQAVIREDFTTPQ
jgi:VWFA-related protein